MEFKDLFITPIYIILLSLVAYLVRPYVTTSKTRKYFLPALWIRFFGAIMLGLIYQFYYGGGDTFTYFHLGSKWVWNAFLEDPAVAFRMIFGTSQLTPENFQFAQHIYTIGDPASYFVVRVAGFFDLITLSTYSATAILFAVVGFVGIWAMYSTFVRFFPDMDWPLAIVILFLPSIFFWGSGLLKDTLTLSALGLFFFGVGHLFIFKDRRLVAFLFLVTGFYVLYIVKIYIIACFFPAVILWIFFHYQSSIKNVAIKVILAPLIILLGLGLATYATVKVGEDHYRYSLETLAYTAESTAKWNYYVSERDQGSGYTLGDFDYSPSGLARKFVPAVATSFFRPFLWEARNPVMLLSALENLIIVWLVLSAIIKGGSLSYIRRHSILILCFLFAILFGFAVGVTTYNFGSLVRYRIPMIPFLMAALVVLNYRKRKVVA